MIDIGGFETGLAECGFDRLLAEIARAFDPLVVHLGERIECAIIFHWDREVTSANADRAMQPIEARAALVVAAPFVP